MKGIIQKTLLFQWGGGLRSFVVVVVVVVVVVLSFFVLSVLGVGFYVLLEDLHVSQLFPCINFGKVKYIVVGF